MACTNSSNSHNLIKIIQIRFYFALFTKYLMFNLHVISRLNIIKKVN